MKKSTLKAQLFSAIAMMLVATVALGTSTYAWFVNNTQVNVEQMNFTATAAKSLEIGVRTSTSGAAPLVPVVATAFKGVLTAADIQTAGANYLAAELRPVSGLPANTNIATMPSFFADIPEKWLPLNDGFKYAASFRAAKIFETGAEVTMIPLSFRSSEDMNVYLKDPTTIFINPIQSATFADMTATEKTLIAKIAGVTEENVAEVNFNAVKTQLATQLTLINKSVRIAFVKSDAGNELDLLTPDATAGVTGERITAITGGSADGTTLPTTKLGSTDVITELHGGVGTGKEFIKTATPTVPALTSTMVPGGTLTDGYITGATAGTELFKVVSGTVSDVTAYIWLEGCDPECVSAISSYNIGVKLDFVGGKTVA